MKKKIKITIFLITLSLSSIFANELTNLISAELQKMYDSNFELSLGSNTCNVGTFTWEESSVGTSFSSYLQNAVQDAVVDTKGFDLILSDIMPIFGPEASAILSQNKEMKLGAFLIFGNYTLKGPSIKLNLKIFSNSFSKIMSETVIELPMELIPVGIQIIPANLDKINIVNSEIDNLYGKSDLDIYATTSRGEGGVFKENEYMKIFLLASENCYVKMFLIGVDGHTIQIFPNQYESNNFLPGKQLLKFPGKTSPFRFQLVPPLGTETIKVIASTKQFSDIGNGFTNMGMATRGIFIKQSSLEEKESMAEAKVFYTILPK